jgi:hypothetical protein
MARFLTVPLSWTNFRKIFQTPPPEGPGIARQDGSWNPRKSKNVLVRGVTAIALSHSCWRVPLRNKPAHSSSPPAASTWGNMMILDNILGRAMLVALGVALEANGNAQPSQQAPQAPKPEATAMVEPALEPKAIDLLKAMSARLAGAQDRAAEADGRRGKTSPRTGPAKQPGERVIEKEPNGQPTIKGLPACSL